jgi:hypothetical protein
VRELSQRTSNTDRRLSKHSNPIWQIRATFYHTTDIAKIARSKSLYIGAKGAWHRSLYDRYDPLDAEAYEDLVLGFRAALEGKVCVLPERLVKYRLGFGLTTADMYDMDLGAFTARRAHSFAVAAAVMRQRTKDALQFGRIEGDIVLKVLKLEGQKAAMGQAYYKGGFGQAALRHPLLGLYIWHKERREMRKFRRAARRATDG